MGAPSGEHHSPDQAENRAMRGDDGSDQRTSDTNASRVACNRRDGKDKDSVGKARVACNRRDGKDSVGKDSADPDPKGHAGKRCRAKPPANPNTTANNNQSVNQSANQSGGGKISDGDGPNASQPKSNQQRKRGYHRPPGDIYGALDLGTNNCRLLLARPSRRGFKVIDAFSRIIRLGENLSQTGRLSEDAMKRTIEALKICSRKLQRHRVKRARFIATEACRIAANSDEFLRRAEQQSGLAIEVLTREAEAGLAVQGCASLIDSQSRYVLVFDIGGGSSELIWLDLAKRGANMHGTHVERVEAVEIMDAWTSLPIGVVTLAEKFGGRHVTEESFKAMVAYVAELIAPFEAKHGYRDKIANSPAHLLGTSGTVTTVAGIKLNLPRYDRARVDGVWLSSDDAHDVTYDLLRQSYDERVRQPCIGSDRADLVLAGCAILEAVMGTWPCTRLRVADRGLREGILATLMTEDGVYRSGRRKRSGGRRSPAQNGS